MQLAIRHTTRYRFDAPAAHGLQRLKLTPKHTQGQVVLDWDMELQNAKSELSYEDEHCNSVTLISVDEGATEVTVTCCGTVNTSDYAGVVGKHSGHLPLWSFRGQTALTRPGAMLRKLIRRTELDNKDDAIARLHRLSAAIRESVAYEIGTTRPDTSAEDALAAGGGVCQDHAHIFIGACRTIGFPARYVSGYLMMNDRIKQDATHAWAEAHVEGLGWVGFDISNAISPDTRYVRVATGRDYRDAAPVTGISFGTAAEMLEVEVAVAQRQNLQ